MYTSMSKASLNFEMSVKEHGRPVGTPADARYCRAIFFCWLFVRLWSTFLILLYAFLASCFAVSVSALATSQCARHTAIALAKQRWSLLLMVTMDFLALESFSPFKKTKKHANKTFYILL